MVAIVLFGGELKEKPTREKISKCEERQVVVMVLEKLYDYYT